MGNAQSQEDAAIIEVYKAPGSGHIGVIEAVVNRNADVNVNFKFKDGKRHLHAAALGGHTGVIENLVALGAYPQLTDDGGETPLHVADASGHIDAIAALGHRRAYKNGTDEEGATPLHFAAVGGHVGAIEKVVELGADPYLGNKTGHTALHKQLSMVMSVSSTPWPI